MYKYLLCWRYLRTRYIALASIISVMLGVATMIVVNSVMAGFADKMKTRLHGILSDVVVESYSLDGYYNVGEVMARIKQVAGDDVVAMSPTMETFGLLKVRVGAETMTRQVQLIGVDPEDRARCGEFAEFLFDDHGRKIAPSFQVSDALRKNSRAGQIFEEVQGGDSAFDEVMKREMQAQVPDNGMIIGYALATIHRDGRDDLHHPAGNEGRADVPEVGREQGAGVRRVYGRRLLQERDERVRLGAGLRPLEALPEDALLVLVDEQGRGAVNQVQIKLRPARRPRQDRGLRRCKKRSTRCGRCTSGSRPGSRSKGRCSRPWRSSRAF